MLTIRNDFFIYPNNVVMIQAATLDGVPAGIQSVNFDRTAARKAIDALSTFLAESESGPAETKKEPDVEPAIDWRRQLQQAKGLAMEYASMLDAERRVVKSLESVINRLKQRLEASEEAVAWREKLLNKMSSALELYTKNGKTPE